MYPLAWNKIVRLWLRRYVKGSSSMQMLGLLPFYYGGDTKLRTRKACKNVNHSLCGFAMIYDAKIVR